MPPCNRAGSHTTPVNLLPIPAPFARGTGLAPTSSYFMLLARVIVPSGQLEDFTQYAQGGFT